MGGEKQIVPAFREKKKKTLIIIKIERFGKERGGEGRKRVQKETATSQDWGKGEKGGEEKKHFSSSWQVRG